jgi:hypothetical protein
VELVAGLEKRVSSGTGPARADQKSSASYGCVWPETKLVNQQRPTALISYSHDGAGHEARVLELANRLRSDGVDCDLDQYVPGGAPPEGWPRWMQSRIEASDFTLMICSPVYARRVLRLEPPDVGRGVIWEANLLYNLLYNDDSFRHRTVPVLLEGGTVADIPLPFRNAYCDLRGAAGYRDLLRRLFDVPRAAKPDLGPVSAFKAVDAALRGAETEAARVATPPDIDPTLLVRLQVLLVDVLGPIGRHLVAEASRRIPDIWALIDALSAEISNADEAQTFRGKARAAVLRGPLGEGSGNVGGDSALLARARTELAVHIGPAAAFLVERAARQARSRQELIDALAAEIPSEKNRKLFLTALAARRDHAG